METSTATEKKNGKATAPIAVATTETCNHRWEIQNPLAGPAKRVFRCLACALEIVGAQERINADASADAARRAAIEASPPPLTKTFALLPHDQIDEAADNERKTFDPAELAELTESVRVHDVHTPVLVHPGTGKRPYELIDGHRRRRASIAAGRAAIPALVCDRRLTAKEIRREQFLANRHRAEIHPIEDAAAMRRMIDEDGETPPSLAKLRGKDVSWVYARLKLCELPDAVKKTCLDGKLPASHAILVARLPREKQVEAASGIVAGPKYGDGAGQVMSYRAALEYVQRDFFLRLASAPFDTKDETLVAGAGACGACPKRSGNQLDLLGDVKDKDTCTDVVCFSAKRAADWDRKATEGMRKGLKVLSDKEAKRAFASGSSELAYNGVWVDPHSSRDVPYAAQPGGQSKSFAQLLGKDLPPKALARDPLGNARELVKKELAVEALRKAGLLDKAPAKATKAASASKASTPASSSAGATTKSKDWKAERTKEAEKQAVKVAARRIALTKIGVAAAKPTANTVKVMRYLAAAIAGNVSHDATPLETRKIVEPGKGNGQQDHKKLLAWLGASARTVDEIRGLAVELVASMVDWRQPDGPLKAAAEALGVDLKACETEAKKEQAEKTKAATPASDKRKPPNLAAKARK